MPSNAIDGDTDLAFQARLHDRGAYPIVAIVVVALVAFVGINLLPASDEARERTATVSRSSSSTPAATLAPSLTPSPEVVELARYTIPWRDMDIHLTAPTEWSKSDSETGVCRVDPGEDCIETNGPSLVVHEVTGVVSDACPADVEAESRFEGVGPTADDMSAALSNLAGPTRSGPTDVMLDSYPAKRFVLTFPDDFSAFCGGSEGRWLWENSDGSHFGLLTAGTATIYVIDVDGQRLVVTSHYRGHPRAETAQLDAVIASIDIEPAAEPMPSPRCATRSLPALDGSGPYLPIGTHSLTVACVEVTFDVGTSGWEVFKGSYITKSTEGPQGAEAIIFWTAFPNGGWASPCANLPSPSVGGSAADLATAVAGAPSTELVTKLSDVAIGGNTAAYVVLTVRQDLGCDPGFFYTWDSGFGGAFWMETRPGDTIKVWIVDMDGTLLFIEGVTKPDAGSAVEQEIEQIVESIRFG